MFRKKLALLVVILMMMSNFSFATAFGNNLSNKKIDPKYINSDKYEDINELKPMKNKGNLKNPFGATYHTEDKAVIENKNIKTLKSMAFVPEKSGNLGEEAYKHLNYISEELGTRSVKEVDNDNSAEKKAREYIEQQFKNMGYETDIQSFEFKKKSKSYNSANVIGIKKGKSSKQIIVGAHYDSVEVKEEKKVEAEKVESKPEVKEEKKVEAEKVESKLEVKEEKKVEAEKVESKPEVKEEKKVEAEKVESKPEVKEEKKIEAEKVESKPEMKEEKKVEAEKVESKPEVKEEKKAEAEKVESKPEIKEEKKVEPEKIEIKEGKGADDNGSGVAVMLEVANILKDVNTDYTIKFVSFGAEELGLQGSKYYVDNMSSEEKANTVAMINIDSLIAGDKMYVYGGEGDKGWVRDKALAIGEKLNLNIETNPGLNKDYPKGTPYPGSGDYYHFDKAGIPFAYFESTNWEIGDKDGYVQTEKDGEIWHTVKDNISYIEENYPGRIEEHLSTFVQDISNLLMDIANENNVSYVGMKLSDDKASMTEPREIDVAVDLGYVPDLKNLKWTFGDKEFELWKKYNIKEGQYNGEPFIRFTQNPTIEGNIIKAKIKFDLVYGTNDLSDRKVRVKYPALLGKYDLKVEDTSTNKIAKKDIKLNVYDSYHTYDEIKPAIDDIFKKAKKDRYLEYQVIGQSQEGRDMHFVILAKDKASVDTYLKEMVPKMLKNPEELQAQISSGQLKGYKVPVFINNIHPDEAPGIDAQINTLNMLTTQDKITYKTVDDSKNEKEVTLNVQDALDHIIFLFNFTENPDGRYYNTRANANGFDVNRDNGYQTQVESRAVTAQIAKWNPISFLDWHGFVKAFLIEPCTPPHDPNYEFDLLMDGMIKEANLMGKAGITNTKYDKYIIPMNDYGDGWDDAAPPYTATYAMHHGCMGHTIEVPELNEDSVKVFEYTALASAKYVMEEKDRLFNNQLEYFKRGVKGEDNRSVDRWLVNAKKESIGRPRLGNENFFPEYYVLPIDKKLQKNSLEVYNAVDYLLRNGIEVQQSTEDVKVGEITYPKGSYIVPMHQAKRGYANTVLYKGIDVSDWGAMYAEIVMNFPDLRGFDRYEIRDEKVFDGKAQNINEVYVNPVTIDENESEYVIQNESNDAVRAVNQLLSKGKLVKIILKSDNSSYEKGDYVVSKDDLNTIKKDFVLDIVPFDKKSECKNLIQPKVACVGSGAVNFVLNDLGFRVVDEVKDADIIVDDSGEANIKDIESGKSYIGIGGYGLNFIKNSKLLNQFEFDTTTTYYPKYDEYDYNHEGLLRAKLNKDSLMTSGYKDDELLYISSGCWIKSVPPGATVLAKVSGDDNFYVAGWWPQHEKVKNQVIAMTDKKGKSNITLFANDITNKDHPQNSFRLLSNAIFDSTFDFEPTKDVGSFEIKAKNTSNTFKLNGDANVTVEATNKGEVQGEVTLIVALYDMTNKKLVNYNYITKTIQPNESEKISSGFKLPAEGNYRVKAFIWDNWNNARPLSDVLEFQVQK